MKLTVLIEMLIDSLLTWFDKYHIPVEDTDGCLDRYVIVEYEFMLVFYTCYRKIWILLLGEIYIENQN